VILLEKEALELAIAEIRKGRERIRDFLRENNCEGGRGFWMKNWCMKGRRTARFGFGEKKH